MPPRTLLPALSALVALSAAGCAPKWEEFKPEGQNFQVLLPGKPKEQTQNVMGLPVKMWGTQEHDGAFAVAVVDVPGVGTGSAEIQKRLDGARDGAVRNVSGTLTKEEKIKLADQYPGRSVEADIPDKQGVLRVRLYIVNGRLYQLLAVGTKAFARSADADRFLDSLQLTGNAAPAKGPEAKGAETKAPEAKAPARKEGK